VGVVPIKYAFTDHLSGRDLQKVENTEKSEKE
jgi:hypothetical protein